MGWGRLKNGELISRADKCGFDIFVTSDQSLRYQQNLTNRQMALLILSTNYWPILRDQASKIQAALVDLPPGHYLELFF